MIVATVVISQQSEVFLWTICSQCLVHLCLCSNNVIRGWDGRVEKGTLPVRGFVIIFSLDLDLRRGLGIAC